MSEILGLLLFYPPIMGATINTVFLVPAFRTFILSVFGVVFTGRILMLLLAKQPLVHALIHSVLTAFLIAGLVYALHADLGWAKWVQDDYSTFAGKSTDNKLLAMEGGLYDFAYRARRIIPYEYTIPNDSSDNYLSRRFEYFLLPLKKRHEARYIVGLRDNEASIELGSRTYARKDMVIRNVQPVLIYSPEAYIVRKP